VIRVESASTSRHPQPPKDNRHSSEVESGPEKHQTQEKESPAGKTAMKEYFVQGVRWIWSLPSLVAILMVRVYQTLLSPLFGQRCRFSPTCSQYCIEALRKYGLIKGLAKSVWRILRCNPFCEGGYDPP